MEMREYEPLKNRTTLRVGGVARYFAEAKSEEEAREVCIFAKEKNLPLFVLGGGSNVVVADAGFSGVVLSPHMRGIEIVEENEQTVTLSLGAGEVLDSLIEETVARGYWGLENLSLIPGFVAGLAIQNVGAYGVEASEYIDTVRAFDRETGEYVTLKNTECDFGYRSSRFNTIDKGRFVVTALTLTLSKVPTPMLSYRGVAERLGESKEQEDIRRVIMDIRKEKDLDPETVWSVGSFFKNHEVSKAEYQSILARLTPTQQSFLTARVFPLADSYKIPSAALIDMLELKRTCIGGACVSAMQANMLVNTGEATAEDIHALYGRVVGVVYAATGITLQNEPEFVEVRGS